MTECQDPLLIFDTHPIQYRAPIFRELAHYPLNFRVAFFDTGFIGNQWWFHEVGTARSEAYGVSSDKGFPTSVLHTTKATLFQKCAILWRCLNEHRPGAVLIYGYYLPEHWILRFYTSYLRIPLIFIGETYAPSVSRFRRILKKPLLDLFFSGVTRFISIGEKNHAYYLNQGIPASRLQPAKYCVDNQFFSATPKESIEIRKQWRLSHSLPVEAKVMLFVGRLFGRKRVQDAIEIFSRVAHKDSHFVIIGNGELETKLKEFASTNQKIHFLGFQDQRQIREAYFGSDLLIVPSEYETWGLVVNEAAACELPALITDTCGVSDDLVKRNITGWIYPKGNISAAASLLKTIFENPRELKLSGLAVKERVEKQFNTQQFASALNKAFHRVTSEV